MLLTEFEGIEHIRLSDTLSADLSGSPPTHQIAVTLWMGTHILREWTREDARWHLERLSEALTVRS